MWTWNRWPIFIRQKGDVSCRLILNLKNLNKDVPYIRFKMKTTQSLLSLIAQGGYLAAPGMKDVYCFVPIHLHHIMFIKFLAIPNDLRYGQRTFAKLIKWSIDTVRWDTKIIAIYVDHLINVRLKLDEFVENVITSIIFLNSPGFIIHPEISIFLPKQEIKFLYLNIN